MELREKLRFALAQKESRASVPVPRVLAPPDFTDLPVERRETAAGAVYVAEERWPLHCRHGRLSLGAALAVGETARARLAPGTGTADLERAAFIDVETTGLAGGTGTLAFLVGVAAFEERRLVLRQYFLASVEDERAMLTALSDVLDGCRAIVSFNGRGFDVPLLESRFVMCRLNSPFAVPTHLDLLPPARRLYGRRLDSCRLPELERSVMGVDRGRDIPGWAVPRVYFDYLRSGETGSLTDVFLHNKLDVLSLVTLLAHVGAVAGDGIPDDPHTCLALARWDEARGSIAAAADLYRAALTPGSDGEHGAFALRRLLRLLRRLGRWDEIERLLTASVSARSHSRRRLEALVELAKHREHHRRDFAAAEVLTREAIALLEVSNLRSAPPAGPAYSHADLHRRLARLQRRLRPPAHRPSDP